MLRLLLFALLVPLSARSQTPCPTTCAAFVAPTDLSRFDQSTGFTAAVYVDDAAVNANRRSDAEAKVAGCLGGELRGVAQAQQVGGQSTYFLSVAGDPNERDAPITFQYCSAQDGDIVASLAPAQNADNTPTFEANTSYGSVAIPYRLQVRSEDLPVELVAFAAVADGSDVLLTWQTASETNNAGFTVERRREAERDFTPTGFVQGAGTTLEARYYAHRLKGLASGTYRFRLRQRDLDGSETISPEVVLTLASESLLHLSVPYPNPSSGGAEVVLSSASPQPARVDIYDALGVQVARLHDGPAQQSLALTLPSHLAPGVYVIRATNGNRTYTTSLVVIR